MPRHYLPTFRSVCVSACCRTQMSALGQNDAILSETPAATDGHGTCVIQHLMLQYSINHSLIDCLTWNLSPSKRCLKHSWFITQDWLWHSEKLQMDKNVKIIIVHACFSRLPPKFLYSEKWPCLNSHKCYFSSWTDEEPTVEFSCPTLLLKCTGYALKIKKNRIRFNCYIPVRCKTAFTLK